MAFDAGTIETKLDIDRTPFKEGLIAARKEAEAFEKRHIKLKVDVDKSFASQIQKSINETQGKTGKGIRIPVKVDEKELDSFKKELERIGDNTESTAKRSGNKVARALLNPLVVQLGLVPAVAMAAGAAGALALGLLPIAIGAVGIAALKSNEQIQSSYSHLWSDIKSDASEFAAPLVGVFVDTADEIHRAWNGLGPVIGQMFKDAAPLISEFTDGIIGFAEQAIPRFQRALALSGPAMRGFSSLIKDTGAGLGDMAIEASRSSVDVGQSTALLGQLIRGLLTDVGKLIGIFSTFWASIGPQFNATFDRLMDAVLRFTEGGLRGMGNTLEITLGLLNTLLGVVGPIADIFGQMGGTILGLVGSWKLFAGVIGLVGKAWGFLKPSEWMGKLSGVTDKIANMGTVMGGWVTKATGSEKAGTRFAAATERVGNAVSRAASAVPLLGAAFIGAQAAVDHFWPSADTLADKILQGGAAAAEARTQWIDYGNNVNTANLWATAFAETSGDVNNAVKAQLKGMTELEQAQTLAAKAQNDYDYAVDKFGADSPQAVQAQKGLAEATNNVEEAQHNAAVATQDHTDKIIEQTNLMLGAVGARLNYQASLLQLEESQRALTDAVKEHGVGSLEARQADIAYQQNLLQTVNAIGARVKAEQAAQGESEATRLATIAQHQEIARLAVAAGTDLPPALAEMAAMLSDTELAQMGVTKSIDDTGNAIYTLPPGKSLAFPNDAPVATAQVNTLAQAIYDLPKQKWFNYYINYVTTGNPPPNTSGPAGSGGLLGSSSGGRAKGGPVRAGESYWVGEEGLPELFFPKVDGFVLNGRDSARYGRGPGTDMGNPAYPAGSDGSAQGDWGMSTDQLVSAFATALSTVLDGAKLEVGGDGMAKIVNRTNRRNEGR